MRGRDATRKEEALTAKTAVHLTTRSYPTEVARCAEQIESVPALGSDRLNNRDLKSHQNRTETQFRENQFRDDDGSDRRRAHDPRNGLH